jgi:hypothetical protein
MEIGMKCVDIWSNGVDQVWWDDEKSQIGPQVYFWFVNEMMNLLYYLYMRLVTVADGWMALPLQFKVSTR